MEESGISGSRVVNSEICKDRGPYVIPRRAVRLEESRVWNFLRREILFDNRTFRHVCCNENRSMDNGRGEVKLVKEYSSIRIREIRKQTLARHLAAIC